MMEGISFKNTNLKPIELFKNWTIYQKIRQFSSLENVLLERYFGNSNDTENL